MENSSVVCSLLALLSYHFGVLFSILAVTYLLCPNSYSILAASTYRDLFFFGWGKNATFAFRELDKIFPKFKDATRKQRVALLRLQYGVDLDEEMRDYYQKYVSRSIKDILRMCMREERMDWIKVCEEVGVLRKAAVEYAIEQATAEKKPAFTAFFLEYQNKHFPLKAGEDNTGLCLPDLPKEKKKKTVDKTSEESI